MFFYLNIPVYGSRMTDSYDGNIFPIYAGNGSLVPPQTSLKESIQNKRVAILFFYLDDSADSKALAPVIAGLDLIWKNNIDIIPLTTDELQNKDFTDPLEEGFYWNGFIPQTIILDETGSVRFDKNGLLDLDELNKIISEIKGIKLEESSFTVESFNEYNSQISKKAKTKIKK
tara:strand:- start:295 stop:813 length:519 start_codon:yes stop_codon:yes gene_type:complete